MTLLSRRPRLLSPNTGVPLYPGFGFAGLPGLQLCRTRRWISVPCVSGLFFCAICFALFVRAFLPHSQKLLLLWPM